MSFSDSPQTARVFTNDALGNDDATALADRIRRRDVSVTELTQGFLCLGKSTLPEFGFNATTEPLHDAPSRNPWNPAYCGLVGLKPTRGRVIDNDAAKSLPINIVSDGVVTRSVRDTANFIHQAEQYFRNPKLPAVGKVEGPPDRPLKIGMVIDSINGHATDDITCETVEATARLLEAQGHRIEPVPIPVNSTFPEDFAMYWGLLALAMKLNGRKITHPDFDKRRVDGLTEGMSRMFLRGAWRLPAILWRLRRARFDYAKAMEGFDAVLTPVLGHTTPKLGHLSPEVPFDTLFDRLTRYANFTPLANVTGAPAISLPMAQTADNLPVSIQLMGKYGGERTLLQLAFALESDYSPWAFRENTGNYNQAGAMAGAAL